MIVEVKIIVNMNSKVFDRCSFLKDCFMVVVVGGNWFLGGTQHLPLCWMELHVPCIILYFTTRMQHLITVMLAPLTQCYCVFFCFIEHD